MNKLKKTLKDLRDISIVNNFTYEITRFNKKLKNVSDLDVLVKHKDFKKVIEAFRQLGYKTSSHDKALGGRFPGYQINIIKPGRIKIDLHRDFTWRAKKYIDLELIWKKEKLVDPFLVFISVIFEKTYLDFEDYIYIWESKTKIFNKSVFKNQSIKYGWSYTFNLIKNWRPLKKRLPIFIPTHIVLVSYLEKFNLISILYYVFFRLRYLITKQLPYD